MVSRSVSLKGILVRSRETIHCPFLQSIRNEHNTTSETYFQMIFS